MFAHLLPNQQLTGRLSLADWSELFLTYMQTIDNQFDPGHRIDHVMRVTKAAIELGGKEGAAMEIVLPAAMLHDTKPIGKFDKDRALSSALSAEHTLTLLQHWGYPSEYYPEIKHAILAHSFSANVKAETLEAQVVQDADRLDALGAIGIARTMACGFKNGNPLYDAVEPFPRKRAANDNISIIDHFYVKLLRLPESFHTTSAKSEAMLRVTSMEAFLQELAREIGAQYLAYEEYAELV